MVAMNVWPTDGADGSVANEARWRKMGRHWAPSGVTPIGNKLAPTLAGTALTVKDGAAWVDGHFAELLGTQVLTVTANGIAVVRFDPAANTAELLYRDGITTPTQSPTGTYELLIASIAGSVLTDRRKMIVNQTTAPNATAFGWTTVTMTADAWGYLSVPASAFGLQSIIGCVASRNDSTGSPGSTQAIGEVNVANPGGINNSVGLRMIGLIDAGNEIIINAGAANLSIHAFAWGIPLP